VTIRLRGVGYAYPGTNAAVLHDIDLDVERGRVLGVVGPNDAGKSTLCLVAAGLAPNVIGGRLDGHVELDAIDVRGLQPYEAAQRAGILFQNPQTQLSGTTATVFEEVAFGPRNLGLDLDQLVRRVQAALAAVGIADLAGRDPQRLSGGQAQLVALASVLALRPSALILDEPTSQLDPAGTRLVGDALMHLAADGDTAILIDEHKTDLLERLAHEVVVLDAGAIVLRGPARQTLADDRLPELGVTPPSAVAIRRAARKAGLPDLPELGPLP
jgi:energy-coupling factor transport system ATP-binding protein